MALHIPDQAAGAYLSIDLGAIVANYRLIASRVAPADVGAVVKADAYGLGAAEVARALQGTGCRDFFVAHLSEAMALCPALDAASRVFVLNGLQIGAEPLCAELGAIPVLNALDQIDRWNALAEAIGRQLPAVIQFDTGMARLGLPPEDVHALAGDPSHMRGLDVQLLMSHLACADAVSSTANSAQRLRFDQLCALFPRARRSLANSGGAFLAAEFRYDLVRTGIALYGAAPNGERPNPMHPVVRLQAPIVQTRLLPAGAGLGYGLTGAATRDRRIATISVGYADGWPRRLGNKGFAYLGDHKVPIVGRVSMDSILLDITDVPEHQATAGTLVELLGPHQTLDDVARDADTISYEILTQLSARYARHYLVADDGDRKRNASA